MANPNKNVQPQRVQTSHDLTVREAVANSLINGVERYVVTATKDGVVESVAPAPAKSDILIDCTEKHRRCVASYRIKRFGESTERLVCDQCVGAGNQNEIMVKL